MNILTEARDEALRLFRSAIELFTGENDKKDKRPPQGGKIFLQVVVIILVVSFLLFTAQVTGFIPGEYVRPWMLWLWLGVFYIVFSFSWKSPILADEIGVRTRLGEPIDIVGPGPAFVPLGVFDINRLNVNVRQLEVPTEPEKVFQGELDQAIPEGMKPPVRITFNESIENTPEAAEAALGERDYRVLDLHRIYDVDWSKMTYEQLDEMEKNDKNTILFNPQAPEDGLARRLTADVVMVVRWRIEDGIKFIKTMGAEGGIEELNKQIEDEMISVVTRLLPKMSFAQAQNNVAWVNAHLFFAVIKRTLGWGAKIEGAYIKKFDAPKRVNVAMADASKAQFEGKAARELAIKKGEGAAQAARDLEEQTLVGRAAGLKKMTQDLGIDGDQVVAAEVARAIAEGGNAIIFGADGLAQAASVVGAMANKKAPALPPASNP